MVNIAIFVSGSGTNCENIIKFFHDSSLVNTALVISNRADAYALVRADKLNVPSVVLTKKEINSPEAILPTLKHYDIQFIVLAGFLLMIPDFLIEAFPGKIINLHPALLPKYGGKGMYGHHVHEAVKASGDTITGMTVHYVSPVCDGGDIIAQFSIDVSEDDSPEDIARKENQLEMKYFPGVIEKVIYDTFCQ